jgi:hypothetical protein
MPEKDDKNHGTEPSAGEYLKLFKRHQEQKPRDGHFLMKYNSGPLKLWKEIPDMFELFDY